MAGECVGSCKMFPLDEIEGYMGSRIYGLDFIYQRMKFLLESGLGFSGMEIS